MFTPTRLFPKWSKEEEMWIYIHLIACHSFIAAFVENKHVWKILSIWKGNEIVLFFDCFDLQSAAAEGVGDTYAFNCRPEFPGS